MKSIKGKKPLSLITGVVASAQGKRKRTDEEEIRSAHRFRASLNSALLRARHRITPKELPNFFANARRLTAFAVNRFSHQEAGYCYLTTLQESPARPLTFELKWLSFRLADEKKALKSFVAAKNSIEESLLRGRHAEALDILALVEKNHGTSLWSTSLRIGILQRMSGDSAQKEFLADLRRLYKSAILPFFARYASQRAESAVPIGWYLENARRRILQNTPGDVNTYFLYRVTGDVPERHKDMATILRIEQNHHIFDIYETYITILQHVSIQDGKESIQNIASTAVSVLGEIPDVRIHKLAIAFGNQGHSPETCDHGATDALLASNVPLALRHARRSNKLLGPSLYGTVMEALSLSGRDDKARNKKPEIASLMVSSAIVASRTGQPGNEQALDFGKKLSFVFDGLPYSIAMRHLFKAIESNDVSSHFRSLKLATLNAREFSVLDIIAYSDRPTVSRANLKWIPSLASREFAKLFIPTADKLTATPILAHDCYALSCAHHHAGNFDGVENVVRPALNSTSRIVSALSAVVALSAYGANGNISDSAILISREVAARGRAPDTLPTGTVFKGLAWRDLAPYATNLSLCNALAAYAEVETNDELLTIRNFALRKALHNLSIGKPSEISSAASIPKDEEYIYFLAKACTEDVLDMLPSLPSSRSVKEERRDICAYLIKADSPRATDYKYDVLTLTKEIAISQGLQTIDASRVHVDIAALRSILRRDLVDSFQRYLSLTKEQAETAETFDSILRELTKSEFSARHLLSMPESDADDLLITMIRQTRERFLFNVPHGLDSYLSKRVRHGSIVGFLRAPAEAEGMITQQHSDGRYKENTRWGLAISQCSEPIELQRAFLAFSRNFDQHLLRLKDVLLHVRSEEKPLGLFDAALTAPNYRIIRSIAITDRTLDGFVDTMLATLRGLINPSLTLASEQLARDTSKYVGELFNNLRASVQVHMPMGQDRTNLLAALNRASAAVQGSITLVSNWFTPIAMEDYKFDMEMVCDIASSSISSIVNGFDPNMHLRDESGLTISVKQLPFFQDILFIILGNVAKWSNLLSPRVDLTIRYDPEASLLRVHSVNDVLLERPLEELKERVKALHQKLKSPEFIELARKDDSSGLAKLASITFQSEHGTMDFGFDSDQRFFVETAISIQVDR